MAKINFIVYDKQTGNIKDYIRCNASKVNNYISETQGIVFSNTPPEKGTYIVNGAITPRPASPIVLNKTTITADGVDKATLSNIPDLALVFLKGIINDKFVHNTGDGLLEITSELTGKLKIKIECFPYLDFEGVINAN